MRIAAPTAAILSAIGTHATTKTEIRTEPTENYVVGRGIITADFTDFSRASGTSISLLAQTSPSYETNVDGRCVIVGIIFAKTQATKPYGVGNVADSKADRRPTVCTEDMAHAAAKMTTNAATSVATASCAHVVISEPTPKNGAAEPRRVYARPKSLTLHAAKAGLPEALIPIAIDVGVAGFKISVSSHRAGRRKTEPTTCMTLSASTSRTHAFCPVSFCRRGV